LIAFGVNRIKEQIGFDVKIWLKQALLVLYFVIMALSYRWIF
jgi:hypothetical protein